MNKDEFIKALDSVLYYNREEFNKKAEEDEKIRQEKISIAKKCLIKV